MGRWLRIMAWAPLLLLTARSALAAGGEALWSMGGGDWGLGRLIVGFVALCVFMLNAILLGFAGILAYPTTSTRRQTLLGVMGVVAVFAFLFAVIAMVRAEHLDESAIVSLLGVGLIAQGGWVLSRALARSRRVTTFSLSSSKIGRHPEGLG